MTTITEALRAARACIQQDRTSLADTGMRHDNTMEPDAAAGVDEYDAVLQQIDAALAGEQPASPDLSRWCVYVAGMISGWLEMARPQIMSMGDEARTQAIAGIIERRLWAMPKDTAPAPAVPSDVLREMREFGKARMAEFMGAHHMALVLSQKINEWADKLTAAPTPPAQTTPEPVGGPWGWAIEDKHGVAQAIRPARKEFFGCVQSTEPFTAEDIAKMDREWVGIAPHRIVTLHTRPAEQPAVPEDVARVNREMLYALEEVLPDLPSWHVTKVKAAIDAARKAGGAA